ncbi:MAG: AAA family ATPase, partial [bacterium]|nr:AAA family ATPase [bacterium]
MKKRDIYLTQLVKYKDKPLIKVITGIRRCGKSALLSMYEEHLRNCGVPSAHIIRMNFESFEFAAITDYKDLYTYINSRIKDPMAKYYLLLDEVQQVRSWEKVINSVFVDSNVDIYITGSNAYLLSSELSTLLSGRYIEIKMLPLSFKEYLDFTSLDIKFDKNIAFKEYLEFGGLPTVVELRDHPETIAQFLNGIYSTVIMKDV